VPEHSYALYGTSLHLLTAVFVEMGNGFWAHFLRLSITPHFYCRQESHQKFNCLSIMGRKRKYTLDAVCEPRQRYIWILYMCTMIGIWSYIYRYIDKSIEWNLDFEWKSRAPTQSLSLSLSLFVSLSFSRRSFPLSHFPGIERKKKREQTCASPNILEKANLDSRFEFITAPE